MGATGRRTGAGRRTGGLFLKSTLLALLVALAGAGAHADVAADAFDAAQSGNYTRAMALWLPLAEDGDANAQYNVGVLFDEGLGTGVDHAAARDWWQKAADQGLPVAMHNLALLELELAATEGADGDIDKARTLLEAAMAHGHARSAYTLGKMKLAGVGQDQDVSAGIELIRHAARAGFGRAQYNMGKAYRDGLGVEADPAAAADWFRRAALQGDAAAQDHYARRLADGDGIDADPVQGLAFALLAARQGNDDALELAENLKDRLGILEVSRAVSIADSFRPGRAVDTGATATERAR
ncbi:MAG: tetratricopeptide repeat protein [Pseudomonadota bacterium]|nr:tetratricopeptide repeat protein [Pseudomonadota bacterium]